MTLAAWTLVLCGTAGCTFTETGGGCASGPGLRSQPFTGASLSDGQWALTFDGGPGAATQPIGDYLYTQSLRASFFATGNEVASSSGELESLKGQGHLVGNRGYSGTPLASAPDPVTEVRKTDELLLPYMSGNMFLLRAPGPGLTDATAQLLNDAGLTRYVGHVGWDVGDPAPGFQPDDACWAAGVTVETCVAGYVAQATQVKHGIILLHDDQPQSATLVTQLVPQLQALPGFLGFVRLDAVPDLQVALTESGGTPGTVGGAAACSEY